MNLQAVLGLETGGFTNAANAAAKAVDSVAGQMKSAFSKVQAALGLVGVSFAAFKSAEGFAESLKGVFEAGKELKVMSTITGESIQSLVTLRKAFGEAGIAPESLETNLTKLQKALGGVNEEGQPTATVFARLGLNINTLKGDDAVTQFSKISAAIGNLRTQSDKMANVQQIFGRGGAEMLAVLGDPGGIDKAKESMAQYGGLMAKNAGLFKEITNTLEGLHSRVKGFFVGFADAIGPVLLPLLTKLKSSLNLVGWGEQLGQTVAKAAKAIYGLFQNGTLSETVGLALRVGFEKSVEFLTNSMNQLFGKAPSMVSGLGRAFAALGDILQDVADIFVGSIENGIATALRGIKIHGVQIVDNDAMNALNKEGNVRREEASQNLPGHLKALTDAGFSREGTSILGDFLKGLNTSGEEAAKKLKENLAGAIGRALWDGFGNPVEAPKEESARGIATASDTSIGALHEAGDRLSKIGLYLSSGGPQNDYARKTAQNTDKMAKAFDAIAQMMKNPTPSAHDWAGAWG